MATTLYDDIVVIQVKTTCTKGDNSLENRDIIEIGACLLNVTTLQTKDPSSLIVSTKKEITDYCTTRTGLASEEVSSGVSFCDAMEFVKENYRTDTRSWASYGSFAHHALKKQCKRENVDFPFTDRFLNVKSWFPVIFNLRKEVPLVESLKRLRLEIPEGKDSLDEVINVAIVLKECIRGGTLNCLT